MRRKSLVILFTVVAGVMLMAGACNPAPATPAKEITVGVNAAFTGPLATTTVPVCTGYIDGLRWINDHGGINGTLINIEWMDNACLVARSVPHHRRFAEKGEVLEINILSSTQEVLANTYRRDKIPALWPNNHTAGMMMSPPQWTFSGAAGFGSEFATAVRWMKENWQESRPLRVGLIFYDHASGWDTLSGSEHFPPGVEFVGYESLPFLGSLDTSVEILRLVGKDPDYIFCMLCGGTGVTLGADMHRLEVQAKGIKIFAGLTYLDESLVNIIGTEAVEGWYQSKPFPDIKTEGHLPGIQGVFESALKYRKKKPEEVVGHYFTGWNVWVPAREALRLAVEKVGLENLDGEAVRNALVSIKDFESDFLPTMTITDEKPIYVDGYKVFQVKQGLLHPISDWLKPAYYVEPE